MYLNELDQYAKQALKCRAYIRYVDDILLFENDKHVLQNWKSEIILFLQTLRLTVHETKAQPRPARTGVPFLGFTVFPDHRRLKSANGYAFQRRLKHLLFSFQQDELSQKDFANRLVSWINHAESGDTWNLRKSIFTKFGIYGGSDG